MGSSVLLFTALGCLWKLMNAEGVSQILIPLHVVPQKKPSPTRFPAQFCSFLDNLSDQPFSTFLVVLASCSWYHSSFGKEETVLLQLSQRKETLKKPIRQEASEMVGALSIFTVTPASSSCCYVNQLEHLCHKEKVNQCLTDQGKQFSLL